MMFQKKRVVLHFVLVFILYTTSSPVVKESQERPFVAVWNSPSIRCQSRYGVHIPVAEYGIVENRGGEWKGEEMVIFYESELGLYPYLTEDEIPINGGIPQSADFQGHFEKARYDIDFTIPNRDFSGFAVIDWESWRPLYERNWSEKRAYQRWSRDLARQAHPTWSLHDIAKLAKRDFERSSRYLMEETLRLGRRMRPNGKWGFYGFPLCDNYGGLHVNCTQLGRNRNDGLSWMYEASSALYPTAYIRDTVSHPENHVYGQVVEALRVRKKFCDKHLPILLYTRYTVGDDVYYTERKLEASLQMAMDHGLEGTIIWGSSASANTAEKCERLQIFIKQLFGPYVQNLLNKSEMCSDKYCQGKGRCVKKKILHNYHLPHFWFSHDDKPSNLEKNIGRTSKVNTVLDLMLGAMFSFTGSYRAIGAVFSSDSEENEIDNKEVRKKEELVDESKKYECHCFRGWTGTNCWEIDNKIEEDIRSEEIDKSSINNTKDLSVSDSR